jgi:hypothetical protein
MTIRQTLTQKIFEAGGRLRVHSALNPILWSCVFVTFPAIIVASLLPGQAPSWLVLIATIPVALLAIGFLFLLFFDRDKLQSEDYQIRKRTLELIEEKGSAFPIDTASINEIANPDYPQLPAKGEEETQ